MTEGSRAGAGKGQEEGGNRVTPESPLLPGSYSLQVPSAHAYLSGTWPWIIGGFFVMLGAHPLSYKPNSRKTF